MDIEILGSGTGTYATLGLYDFVHVIKLDNKTVAVSMELIARGSIKPLSLPTISINDSSTVSARIASRERAMAIVTLTMRSAYDRRAAFRLAETVAKLFVERAGWSRQRVLEVGVGTGRIAAAGAARRAVRRDRPLAGGGRQRQATQPGCAWRATSPAP